MEAQESELTPRQEADTIEESEALRIPEEKAEEIVEALQVDLASTYVLYHQIKKHHWVVEGAEFLEIHEFLGEAAEELEEAADELAERIQALGGVPVASGAALEERSPLEPEGEDVYDIRPSLEHDMALYGDMIESLREHVKLANSLGDYTTEEQLKETLEDAEEYAHHIEHYLEDDTLVTDEAM